MFARNAKWAALILSAALVSCSQQDDLLGSGAADGTEITTTVSLKAPVAMGTRGVPNVYETTTELTYFGESGMPSIGNLDLKDDPLTFTVGIYVEKKGTDGSVFTLVDKQDRVNVQNDEAYFNFRLLKGQTYRIVAYADYSGAAQADLENIDFTKPGLNRERDDAFFVSEDFVADDHVAAVLKRPFGKLRLIARDFNTFAKGEKFKFTNVKVTYKNQGSADGQNPMLTYNRFNALSKDFGYVAPAASEGEETPATPATPTVTTEYTSAPAVYQAEYGENGEAEYATVFTMYLPANFGEKDTSGDYAPVEDGTPVPQSWMYPFDVEVTYENTEAAATTPDAGDTEASTPAPTTVTRSFAIDIPVKRNWLTTVDAADFWTDNSNIKVSVDPRFEGFITAVPEKQILVNSWAQLAEALNTIMTTEPYVGKIILGQDIYINTSKGKNIYRIDENDKYADVEVHLDLNGHKIATHYDGDGCDGTNHLSAEIYKKVQKFNAVFRLFGKAKLIIDDSSKDASGAIINKYIEAPLVYCYNGASVTINAGKFIIGDDNPAIYSYDHTLYSTYSTSYTDKNGNVVTDDYYVNTFYNNGPSHITINGGWFENPDGTTPVYKKNSKGEIVKDENGNPIISRYYYNTLINIYNDGNIPGIKYGYGYVSLNGGSYVDFDPAQSDNIIGDATNKWVNPDTHTILKETINGHTVHTVIAKDNPTYY